MRNFGYLALALLMLAGVSAAAQETAPAAAQPEQPKAEPAPTEAQPAPAEAKTDTTTTPAAGAPAETAAPAAEPPAPQAEPTAEVKPIETAEPEPAAKEEKDSWLDHITIYGDFRFRHELILQEDEAMRNRERIRARVGLDALIIEDLNVGLMLGTGVSGDPISTNQDLGEAFSSKPVWLDLAYADYHPSFVPGLHGVVGKMKNPFYTVGKTELVWDNDLTPEGLSLNYANTFGIVEPFAAAGAYWAEERKEEDDSWLLGVQAGARVDVVKKYLYIKAGVGYYDYTATIGNTTFYDTTDGSGNTVNEEVNEDDETMMLYFLDYNEIEGFAEAGGEIATFPWAVFGDYVRNLGVTSENTGWLVGLTFGKLKESLDYMFRYSYRQLESDAVMAAFTDSDFAGGGSDVMGHKFCFDFQIVRWAGVGLNYFYNQKPIEDSKDMHKLQLDLNLKF